MNEVRRISVVAPARSLLFGGLSRGEGMMVVRSSADKRIALVLPESATAKQQRELGAFARYCILRVERELGERDSWVVSIAPSLGGYASHIAVQSQGEMLAEQGKGQDGALATWDAICRVEQRLRERRR